MVFNHADIVNTQATVERVANSPIDHSPQRERAKATPPFLTVQNTLLHQGTVADLLPGATEPREQLLRLRVLNSVTVVSDLYRFQSAEGVVFERHVYSVRLCVESVPDQFGNFRQQRGLASVPEKYAGDGRPGPESRKSWSFSSRLPELESKVALFITS